MNDKISPVAVIFIIVIALNILGLLLELLVESAVLALIILAGYAIYMKFIKKV